MSKISSSWYTTFFSNDYLRIYAPFLPPERTIQEVEHIIHLLQLSPHSHIMDLCCGHGRHAIPLAQRGYRVTGVDLSPVLLQRARTEADQHSTNVLWLQSDMRNLPFKAEFDAIINIFSSFGYLENENEDQRVIDQIARSLKPGGLFLLETVHLARVLRSHTPHGIIRYPDGLVVLEERSIDLYTNRNEVRVSLIYPDGQRFEHHQSLRIYTVAELVQMLTKAGLHIEKCYGGLDQCSLSMDSRLVLLARKTNATPQDE